MIVNSTTEIAAACPILRYERPVSSVRQASTQGAVPGPHLVLTVPHFLRLEHSLASLDAYRACMNEPLYLVGEHLRLSDRPGLGFTLNLDYLRERAVEGFSSP